MNLLPKSHEEFSQKDYWDTFFKKRGNTAFEWYGEYPELSEHLHKYIKQHDDILITGCGNSTLGRDLYDIGFNNIANIDISNVVITQMLKENLQKRPHLKYLQMDALQMEFAADSFSVVLDKGTLDALMPDAATPTVDNITKYFSEIKRVLKMGGRYLCISLLQEHILKILLDYFVSNSFIFRIVRCFEAEQKAAENGEKPMPVFLIVCTKFRALPVPILEVDLSSRRKLHRLQSISDMQEQIASVQHAAFVCNSLKNSTLSNESEVMLDLYETGSQEARFTVHIVGTKIERKNTDYAAFIVPQGREVEWLFSTKAGRQHLIKATNTNRLAIVTMHRGQKYGTFREVQDELSDVICNLAPARLKTKKIMFLSLGSDVGTREVRFEGCSKFSGSYIVEDVAMENGSRFRRLFYLNSQNIIQSEARLKKKKGRKGDSQEVVDLLFLTCKHHVYMSIACKLACQKVKQGSVAIIGLGGGGLCSFLHKFMPQTQITGVEIDEDMLTVAKDWFGLSLDNNMRVVIKDGLHFFKDAVQDKKHFDAILFDVDNKDSLVGLSCPPKQFLEESVLDSVAQILKDTGFFILNLVLRENNLRPEIIHNLKQKFKTIVSYQLEEDLNEIFICSVKDIDLNNLKTDLNRACLDLNSFSKRFSCENNIVGIENYLEKLSLNT